MKIRKREKETFEKNQTRILLPVCEDLHMEMSGVRIFGIIIGLFIFFLSFRIFRGQKWNRLNFFLMASSGIILLGVSLNPALLNILQNMFAFENADRGRILALLIVFVIFLWFIVIFTRTALLQQKRQFDQFVRATSIERYAGSVQTGLADCEAAVLIPAYNEASNLKELLPDIPRSVNNIKLALVVVDDGSEDDTYTVARSSGAFVVHSPINRGGGAALRLGYDILKKANIPFCVTMDADGQHDPKEIPSLLDPLLKNRFDIIIGSRIIGSREKDSLLRLTGVYFFGFVIRRLTGVRITDPSSNFRGVKTNIIDRLYLAEDQYHTSELIISAAKAGFRIGEVPITLLKRKHGTSKKGKDWKYGLNFAKIVVKSWWR